MSKNFFSLMSCSDFFIKSIQTQNILQHSIQTQQIFKHSFLPFKHSFFLSFLYRNGIFSWPEIVPDRERSNRELYTTGNGPTGNGTRPGMVWPRMVHDRERSYRDTADRKRETGNGVPSQESVSKKIRDGRSQCKRLLVCLEFFQKK